MISPNTEKSMPEVLENYFSTFSKALNCVKIGEIVSFDKQKQTADIKVLVKNINNFNLKKRELIDFPILGDVPVIIMGGGTSYITHPISTGDQCLLLFSDYCIDNWQNTGTSMPPFVKRRHDISDAIAIVGLRALPNAIQNYSDFLDLHYSDNSSIIVGDTIEVNNQTINLNGNANVSGVVTAPTLNATEAATGTFVSSDSKAITVVNGIITAIT